MGRIPARRSALRLTPVSIARQALLARILTTFAVLVPVMAHAGDAAPDTPDAAVTAQRATADASPTPASGVGQLQSITVTATKRREEIKDIPTSVSAIDGDSLQEHHVANYDDITRTVPGISFQAGGSPGLSNIEMRGVSSTSGSATVGIYIDEVSVTTKNTFDGAVEPKLFDLDRIEVLRGPQGTLFGASSMGGTIRFITKQPEMDKFSSMISTDTSLTKHGDVSEDAYGIVNIPVIPGTFALRLGVDLSHQSGYIDHFTGTTTGIPPGGNPQNGNLLSLNTNDSTGILSNKNVNGVGTQVYRLTGKYLGGDDLTITPSVFYQNANIGDNGVFFPSIGQYQQDKRVQEPGHDTVVVPSLTINKGFGFGDLTSVTSNFRRDFNRQTDGTFYNSNIFSQFLSGPPNSLIPGVYSTNPGLLPPAQQGNADQINYQTLGVIGFLPSIVKLHTTTEQFSQELRLTSKDATLAGMPFSWVGGVYYSDLRQYHDDVEPMVGLQNAFNQIYGFPIEQSVFGPAALPGVSYANDVIYEAHSTLTERQLAPFGELGLNLTPALKAALGLRYVTAKQSYHFTSGGFYALGLPNPYSDNEKFSATTPKFSLDYAIDEHRNVYTSVAKGFRLGGPTGPDPVSPSACDQDYAKLHIPGAPLKYDSDTLWSYEVGSKGRYFNNRLSVNAALYAIDWKNIQQTVNLPTCGFGFTTNAGDAKSYGTEVEVRALVTDSLTLSLNAGSTHAYITRTANRDVFQVGEDILNVPEYTATVGADYDTDLTDTMQGFVRADYAYTGQSHAYYNSSSVTNHFSPAYGILNLSMGFTQKKFSFSLYAKNLLDNKQIIQYPSVNTVQEGYTVRPLTVGITASYQM